jgi:hypothetical protein
MLAFICMVLLLRGMFCCEGGAHLGLSV